MRFRASSPTTENTAKATPRKRPNDDVPPHDELLPSACSLNFSKSATWR
jgi:hypothetical protein